MSNQVTEVRLCALPRCKEPAKDKYCSTPHRAEHWRQLNHGRCPHCRKRIALRVVIERV